MSEKNQTRRVAVIGGVERNKQRLEALARQRGWELDYHGGHMEGRGRSDLETYVDRADLVLVATNVNSHGAVTLARDLAARRGVSLKMMTSCSPSAFRGELDRHAPPPSA